MIIGIMSRGEVEALGCLCSVSPTQKHASPKWTKEEEEVSSSCSTAPLALPVSVLSSLFFLFFFLHFFTDEAAG